MSRYVNVRGKHKNRSNSAAGARVAPQPVGAAPGGQTPMPTEEQMEHVARDRYKAVLDEVYKLRNGDVLDASIARWKGTLALYDREREAVEAKGAEGHRWTVSPSIALRIDVHLAKLIERREELLMECHAEAEQILIKFMQEYGPKGDSLCPPKQTSAPTADVGATLASPASDPSANPAEGGEAAAPPIAA